MGQFLKPDKHAGNGAISHKNSIKTAEKPPKGGFFALKRQILKIIKLSVKTKPIRNSAGTAKNLVNLEVIRNWTPQGPGSGNPDKSDKSDFAGLSGNSDISDTRFAGSYLCTAMYRRCIKALRGYPQVLSTYVHRLLCQGLDCHA